MTREQLEELLDKNRENMLIALDNVINSTASMHAFDFARVYNQQLQKPSRLVLFIAHEVPATVIEGTMEGLDKAIKLSLDVVNAVVSNR